ncbi:MAG: branched-chain amino acid ABC transporter permease [Defluviitaleaceae bacterium]|nr:branched-chain amino acid ABC transporter permease [Defluviitaleaceae bacterium]
MNKVFGKIGKTQPYFGFLVFGAILSFAPVLMNNTQWFLFAWLTIFAGFIVYAIAGLGMNILMGYGGLASLGTAGFMGLGAYLTMVLTVDAGFSFFPVLFLTILATTILGIVVGLVSLRVEGFFLAIATLVIAEMLRQVFQQMPLLGGHAGRSMPAFPTISLFGILEWTLNRNQTYIMLVIFLVIAMFITQLLFKSATGRALSAMRGSESAAAAMGISIFRGRLLAFALASGFAGAAGSLFMFFMPFTNPNHWNLVLSLFIFAVVVIGGVRSVAGTVLGAFIVFAVPQLFIARLPVIGDISGMDFVFTGVLIIIVVLFYPAGLIWMPAGIKNSITKLIKRKKGGETT